MQSGENSLKEGYGSTAKVKKSQSKDPNKNIRKPSTAKTQLWLWQQGKLRLSQLSRIFLLQCGFIMLVEISSKGNFSKTSELQPCQSVDSDDSQQQLKLYQKITQVKVSLLDFGYLMIWSAIFKISNGVLYDMSHMGMVDDGILVYIVGDGDRMVVVDVWRRQCYQMPARQQWNQQNYYQMIVFRQSRVFCVVEAQIEKKVVLQDGGFHYHRLATITDLYYFGYDRGQNQFKFIGYHKMEITQNSINLCQLDNHSKIGWMTKDLLGLTWVVNMIQLDYKKQLNLIKIQLMQNFYHQCVSNLLILWEIETDILLACVQYGHLVGNQQIKLVCLIIQRTTKRATITKIPFKIIGYQCGENQQCHFSRVLPVQYKCKRDTLLFLDCWQKCKQLQNCIHHQKERGEHSIVMIDLQQKVVQVQENCKGNFIFEGGQDKSPHFLFMRKINEGKHLDDLYQIAVTSKHEIKDCYMLMLLHLYQDFDDDLLYDAMQLLIQDL